MSWSFIRKIPKTLLELFIAAFQITDDGDVTLSITDQNNTTDLVDAYFLQPKATGLTLAVDTAIDSRLVTLTAGHGLTTANSAEHIFGLIDTIGGEFYQGRIIEVTGDVVELAPALGKVFTTTGSTAGTGNPNMIQDAATGVAIDGSVTPVVFALIPRPNQLGDVNRVLMSNTTTNAGDITTFGGSVELDLGILLRKRRESGEYKNIFTFRNNFDFKLYGFDFDTDLAKVVANDIQGFSARLTFNGKDKHGTTVRLDGDKGEQLQIVISELMNNTASGNISMSFLGQGSEVQISVPI